jgi:uncharacterized protein DUF6364
MTKKTNVTLKLDSELLQRIKVLAAERGTSISAMLSTQLEKVVLSGDRTYEDAMNRAIAQMKESTGRGWRKPKSRDELHER